MESVIERGQRVRAPESLLEIRERFSEEWGKLPEIFKAIHHPGQVYPVEVCQSLKELDSMAARLKWHEEVEERLGNRMVAKR
jgi:hypothetical protein